ncbi:P-loop containing nucleoside triphosphate hydrolase protein [Sporormia fimetaria CBS 119925]|uniref:RNA helicase n=1 Tax=Sporormia fimetaria CBS 119925 TaxID=1340428 RepID=A0A6A6V467_9PLEO|nr:P-loop containing nucleoside triphosphate hydrolase protein [Sporormia fimetaria CBS 119925]
MDTAEDEVDPLDAFMDGLTSNVEPVQNSAHQRQRGEAMFGEDADADNLEPVGDLDLLALNEKRKKKKDIPIIDHSKMDYPPFKKAFYHEPTEISEMTPEEVADMRLEMDGIKVKPKDAPRPVRKWAQMGLSQQTLDVLHQIGFTKPTSIQAQAIPVVLSGRDMIGVAKTGSGKTLAYGMPIIRHVLDQPDLKPMDGPIALILAPTRELATQIMGELKPFLKASNLRITAALGGDPISHQIAAIKRGVHVLVGTPGRLIDLLQSNSGRVLRLNRVTYVVIDEADRMFDMGFGLQITRILGNVRPDRQTLLFSATFPKAMADLARKTLTNPVEVNIGGLSTVPPEITQVVKVVEPTADKKLEVVLFHLGQFFNNEPDALALIFVERQETAEDMLQRCMKRGYPCNAIHGGKDQTDRTDAINDFRNGHISLLIATSVAARGLDVPQLKLVINYDCPTHLEDYVHRCGRTGRAGNTGTAITLIEDPGQERFAVHVAKALKQSGQEVPPELQKMADVFFEKVKNGTEKYFGGGFGGKGLDKLDAARNQERKREKRALKGDFGDESDSEPEPLPEITKTPAVVAAPGQTGVVEEAEPEWMQILKGAVDVIKTERPALDTPKAMTAMERARAAALSVNGRLSKGGAVRAGQPIDNKGPDAGAFHATITINPFPQKARWAVTNRTNVAKILEQTGTSITTKGTYYPPGSGPKEEADLPPLYILVEGDTENQVADAMHEIRQHLRDGAMADDSGQGARGATGRYNVLRPT